MRLDDLRCQQLLPAHVFNTLRRGGEDDHRDRARSAHMPAATAGDALCHAELALAGGQLARDLTRE